MSTSDPTYSLKMKLRSDVSETVRKSLWNWQWKGIWATQVRPPFAVELRISVSTELRISVSTVVIAEVEALFQDV